MRNPLQSWDKCDSYWNINEEGLLFNDIGENDLKLAMQLSKAGSDHAKYLRQIQVWVDVTAPEYWWKEYETYQIGTVENSTSQMHTLGNRWLDIDDFSFDDGNEFNMDTIDKLNILIDKWWLSGKKKPSPEWRQLIQNIPQSFIYLRTVNMNYQTLKNMYHARSNHYLQEWRDFCIWINSLPYSELITLNQK